MSKKQVSGKMADWTSTVLWVYLEQSKGTEAGAVKVALESCMPDIQDVLAQGGTAPLDFTLHDAGHGFRVAQRMADIIPEGVLGQLTPYELALLLLSAYLHDIGMTPARQKVTAHYNYLLTGEDKHLTREEIDAFQKWIDDEGRNVEPPLAKGTPTGELLRLAEEITAYYCRHRHNDWGAEWVRGNLGGLKLGSYDNWLEDLVDLCRSHHYGYGELIKKRFDPRTVGAHGAVVHLRYLACVLRVADVLEVDPERTPEVIFRHRAVGESSILYWYKDHQLSLLIQKEKQNVVIAARPSRAYIHKAIEVTVDQIDEELRVCRALADETHFETHLTLDLPHRWMLPRAVHRDINPAEGTYEYIDGAFRPDTQKLLELLSGVELYGTPLAAVRELLQNAFDAVREQVAYQRLERAKANPNVNPADPQLEQTLGQLHQVGLRLESNEEGAWLVCTDTGVGMSKSIITYHLLVSGLARRHDVLELERRARQAGFTLGRTGQFGIGVLSYFMVADRIVIRTRRSQLSGSSEGHGWRFETRGVGSFGELRQDNSLTEGTEIRLRLRPETVGASPTDWYAGLRAYIKETLLHIPCQFTLTSRLPGCDPLDLPPGWVRTREDFTRLLVNDFDQTFARMQARIDTPLELLPAETRHKYEEALELSKEVAEEFTECLRWQEHTGSLPDDLGMFRIGLPYFELPGGNSLNFLRVREQGRELLPQLVGEAHTYAHKSSALFGWKGMTVGALNSRQVFVRSLGNSKNALLEVVFTSPEAAKVTVSRNSINLSEKAQGALDWLSRRVNSIEREFVSENVDSAYHTLNVRLVSGAGLSKGRLKWVSIETSAAGNVYRWQDLNFPVAGAPVFSFDRRSNLSWNGKRVEMVARLLQLDTAGGMGRLAWSSLDVSPEYLLISDSSEEEEPGTFDIRWLWTRIPEGNAVKQACGDVSRFPEKWQSLCGVSLYEYSAYIGGNKTVWNPENKVVAAVDREGWEWAQAAFDNTLDPLCLKAELFESKGRLGAWIICCINAQAHNLWDGLPERDALFLPSVWEALGLNASPRGAQTFTEVLFLNQGLRRLSVLTPESWQTIEPPLDFSAHLPDPGPEWRLVVEGKGAARKGAPARGEGASKKSGAKTSPPGKVRAAGGRGAKKGAAKKKR